MSTLTNGLLKLIVTGLVCGGLLSLGGRGPLRELLRFGCACLSVVLLLTMLRQAPASFSLQAGYEAQLQNRVEQAQHELKQTLLKQTEQGLASEIERQAKLYLLDCAVSVSCHADINGQVLVDEIAIQYRRGPREKLWELRQTIAAQLAVPTEKIIVSEEAEP